MFIRLVRWQDLDDDLRARARSLSIPADQIEFAGSLDRAIEACEQADPQEVAGLAILGEPGPVGFVVLRRGSRRPDWAPRDAVALTAMRIDASLQGRGFGKAALAAVDVWLAGHWPASRVIALSVDDGNAAGRRAYAQAGYREYAEPKPGRIGVVRYLSKDLPVPEASR